MEDILNKLKRKIENYEKAVKYLDECGEFEFDNLVEAHRIASTGAPEVELRDMWSESKLVLPSGDIPGGVESMRKLTRDSFTLGMEEFQKLVDSMGNL